MLMTSALFWDNTRRRVLIVYRRFGTITTTPRNIPEERRSTSKFLSYAYLLLVETYCNKADRIADIKRR